MIKRILFVFLITPLMLSSQALTGYDFSCRKMEILDPVKYSDEYYVIEETRTVDLKVSFYHDHIIIYDYQGMVNFCIEYIPEWNRYKNIYRLRDLTYIGHR